jgi:hypothetical protein
VNPSITWWAALVTAAIPLLYELVLWWAQRQRPTHVARTAHANLREEWFSAVGVVPGSEILAVQTLRNSLMSATMIASTAAIGLMGAASLVAPSLHPPLEAGSLLLHVTPRLAMELLLMATLFASLVYSVMAVRYYNHVGFIVSMPVGSAQRGVWAASGAVYVRRAGLLYGWGLRHLILVAPMLGFIVHPLAGPVAAVLVVLALWGFDRLVPGR